MTSLAAVVLQPSNLAAPSRAVVEDRMTRGQVFGLALGLDLAGWAAVILFLCMI